MILRTAVAKIIALPISTGMSVLNARLAVSDLGVPAFGVLTLVTGLISLIGFADFGLSAAVVNQVAQSPRHHETTLLVRTAWTMLWASVGILLSTIIFVALALDWESVTGAHPATPFDGNIFISCILGIFTLSIPLGLGQRILVGLGRVDLSTSLQVAFPALSLVLAAVAHSLHRSWLYFLGPAVAQFAASALIFIAAYKILPRHHGTPLRFSLGSHDLRRKVANTALPMLVISTGLPLALQSDRLILSHLAGSGSLGSYAVASAIYTPAWGFVSILCLNLWPHFAKARLLDHESVREHYTKALRLFILTGIIGSFAILLLAAPTARLLLQSGDATPTQSLWASFALLLLVQVVHLPAGMRLTDPAGLRFQARCVVLMCITNVPTSILLTVTAGSSGPVLGSAISITFLQAIPGFLRSRRQVLPEVTSPDAQPQQPEARRAAHAARGGEQ